MSIELHYVTTSFPAARFAFSSKERDTETGLSYFGARYYSSDLSVWLSVDPMSGKYPSLSPYVYCANNPVKLVDPNGEEIVITESVDDHGNKVININFTAQIINKSSHKYTDKEMQQLRDKISTSIQEKYSGKFEEGVIVNTTVAITCNGERSDDLWLESNRHTINIVDNCSNLTWSGEAQEGGNFMNLRWDLGYGENSNSIERTSAHEFGHLLGLPDNSIPGNLMNNDENGIAVSAEQINTAVSNYRSLNLNYGIISGDRKRWFKEKAAQNRRK